MSDYTLSHEEKMSIERVQRGHRLRFIREELKRRKWTYAQIASRLYKHPATVSRALRGGFPYDGGNHLPVYLENWLAQWGILATADANYAAAKAEAADA